MTQAAFSSAASRSLFPSTQKCYALPMNLRRLLAFLLGIAGVVASTRDAHSQILYNTCEILHLGEVVGVVLVADGMSASSLEHFVLRKPPSVSAGTSSILRIQAATERSFQVAREMGGDPQDPYGVEKDAHDYLDDRDSLLQRVKNADAERPGAAVETWNVFQCDSAESGCDDDAFQRVGTMYELLDDSGELVQELWALEPTFRYQSAENVTELRWSGRDDITHLSKVAATAPGKHFIHVAARRLSGSQARDTLTSFVDNQPLAQRDGCAFGVTERSQSVFVGATILLLAAAARRRRRP